MTIRCSRASSLARAIVPPSRLDHCMHPCRALLQRLAWVLQQSWCQSVPNLARRLVGATGGDVDGYMRPEAGAAEVRDVSSYFAKVEALLTIRQTHWHPAGVDIIKRDPPEDILGSIPKHDNGGVSCLVDNFPVATQQAARRQRNDAIAAVLSRENILQGLRRHEAEIVRRQGDGFEDARSTFRRNARFQHPSRKTDIQGGQPVARPRVVLPTQLTPARNQGNESR